MNIAGILQRQAHKRPDAQAIIDVHGGRERVTTFAGLETASARGAALLREAGLVSGDTVLVFQPMSAELYIALMALFRLGITAMFLDPSAGREHIERCCAIRQPAALIAPPKAHLLRLISPALRRIPCHICFSRFMPGCTSWSRSERIKPHQPIAPCTNDTPALITFTSGSTGQPKAAVRSHGFLLEQHRVLERTIHLTTGALDLTTLPVFVLANLASGVTSLIPDADLRCPGGIEAAPILRQIERHCPASVAASPAFMERICVACESADRTVPGFRYVFTGGAPVFPDHLDRLAATFPDAEIVAVYGSTESEPIAHISRRAVSNDDLSAMKAGGGLLAGEPVPEITVRVIAHCWGTPLGSLSESGFSGMCLPTDTAGEIVVTGGHVLKGYLHGTGDEETKFRVNETVWHRTGDSGYFDDAGRLWLLGRSAAVINDERGHLYPFAVECAARQFSGISRAALVNRQGQRILFVQSEKGAHIDTTAVRNALAWARLDTVRELDEIPLDKRHNAKIDYGRLARID
ncbi:MAG: AMP-dependent synthetase [Nitrospirae bacterium GWC2_56_14]|nr:MAG: AMP-dependent synthetase [Nitrospirae bacterium GWC2_56_14]